MAERKTVFLTGALGGIGKAIARFMYEDGHHLLISDLDESLLKEFALELGEDVNYYACNLENSEDIERMAEKLLKEVSGIDILINCAGILSNNKMFATGLDEWRKIHAVNLDAPFYLCQKFAPYMKEQGWGRIINIISYAWKSGGKTSGTAYSSSKGGLVGLTFAMAKELAEFGVTVNGIAPAYVLTDMVLKQLTQKQREEQQNAIPVKKFAKPEEVAHSVRYLSSPLAGFITGEIIDMNGGFQFD